MCTTARHGNDRGGGISLPPCPGAPAAIALHLLREIAYAGELRIQSSLCALFRVGSERRAVTGGADEVEARRE
jgi:hypothetical protein